MSTMAGRSGASGCREASGGPALRPDAWTATSPSVAGACPHARNPSPATRVRASFMEPDAAYQALRPCLAYVAQLEAGAAHHRSFPEHGAGGTGNGVVPLRNRPLPAR